MEIRVAKEEDALSILNIYAPYVQKTNITFEYDVPCLENMKERIVKTLSQYPYLVAIVDNQIVGYAYGSCYRTRQAYQWDSELSVYVDEQYQGQGIASLLYQKLLDVLTMMNIQNVYACITYPNEKSIAFHKKFGFEDIGKLKRCGYKFNQWHNTIWMEKAIGNKQDVQPVIPFLSLTSKSLASCLNKKDNNIRGDNVETLIIGSGFAGSVVARVLAERGEQIKIIEKRDHIGGNCYDEYDEYGVLVHKYGPHIFHTNNKEVYDFLSRFTSWYDYQHVVVGDVYGKIIPIPFNLNTLMSVFGEEKGQKLKKELIDTYGENARVPILELQQSSSQGIQEVAQYVYENIFLKYTMKQWNQKPEEVDQSVTARVPVLISYDNRYFQDTYQGMPRDGYTKLFENMLNHPNISIEVGQDAKELLRFDFDQHKIYYQDKEYIGKIIFTGAIDEFFDNCLGQLPYRSLRFDFEHYSQDDYQGHGVVNYTVSEDYTRITEFKYLTGQQISGTTIIKEYPEVYKDNRQVPYYAILNSKNIAMHQKYVELVKPFSRFYLLGRLAQYKYYNIDGIVEEALKLCQRL